jgi:adhesin transport system outer membrane protein
VPRFFLTLLLIAAPRLSAQPLEEAVRAMLAFEPELLAAHADTHSAEEDVRVVRGDRLPQVRLSSTAGAVNRDRTLDGLVRGAGQTLFTRDIGISLTQLLFDGGSAALSSSSAAHAHDMQTYLERGMIEARVVDLAEVYQEILRTGVQIEEARRNIEVHERIRAKVHDRAGVGGTKADTTLVDSRLVAARDALIAQELAQRRAVDRFLRLTGTPPDNLVTPRLPAIPSSLADVNLDRNWSFLSAEAALLATEDKLKAAERANFPKLFLDAGVREGRDVLGVEGTDDEMRALITMQWDLVTGGSRAATTRREGWQAIRAHELLRAADLERNYRLTLLWREREGDLRAVASLGQQADFLAVVAEDYEDQFLVGKHDLLDILDVRNRHYEVRSRFVDAEFNLKTGAYRILGVQGRLVEFLLGEGAWDDVAPGSATPSAWSRAVADLVKHPHHPGDDAVESHHTMAEHPHEEWDLETPSKEPWTLVGALKNREAEAEAEKRDSPLEPVRGWLRSAQPVTTRRPHRK